MAPLPIFLEAIMNNNRAAHPLMVIAALSLTLFSLAGTAALMGWLPQSKGNQTTSTETLSSTAAMPGAPLLAAAAPAVEPDRAASPSRLPAPPRPARAETRAAVSPPERPLVLASPPEPAPPVKGEEPAPALAQAAPAAPPVVAAAPEIAKPACLDCGVIQTVRPIQVEQAPSGVGAVAGGVAGAVLGRQVGNGRGRDLLTVVGAVGGAVAGHQVEKKTRTAQAYEIVVRFEDGSTQKLTQPDAPSWRPGDRVRVVAG
jgi:outer membrane lipoprotein SlyB